MLYTFFHNLAPRSLGFVLPPDWFDGVEFGRLALMVWSSRSLEQRIPGRRPADPVDPAPFDALAVMWNFFVELEMS